MHHRPGRTCDNGRDQCFIVAYLLIGHLASCYMICVVEFLDHTVFSVSGEFTQLFYLAEKGAPRGYRGEGASGAFFTRIVILLEIPLVCDPLSYHLFTVSPIFCQEHDLG